MAHEATILVYFIFCQRGGGDGGGGGDGRRRCLRLRRRLCRRRQRHWRSFSIVPRNTHNGPLTDPLGPSYENISLHLLALRVMVAARFALVARSCSSSAFASTTISPH